jgi:hypothetical protein
VIKQQTLAESFYTRGRSANCDCTYSSQNYTHTIHSNSNFMVSLNSSPPVVEQLHINFASVYMNINQFRVVQRFDLSRDENKSRG